MKNLVPASNLESVRSDEAMLDNVVVSVLGIDGRDGEESRSCGQFRLVGGGQMSAQLVETLLAKLFDAPNLFSKEALDGEGLGSLELVAAR